MKNIFIFIILVLIVTISCLFYFTDSLSYRLGDSVLYEKFRNDGNNKLLYSILYKDSIAYNYLKRSNKTKDYDLLYTILKEKSKNNKIPDEDTIVIHVRTGDVIDDRDIDLESSFKDENFTNHYIKSFKYYKDNLEKEKEIKKILIVTGFHRMGKKTKSKEYINRLKLELEKINYEVKLSINEFSADEDFIFMSMSKYFLKSGGNYSKLINEMVKRNGGNILYEDLI